MILGGEYLGEYEVILLGVVVEPAPADAPRLASPAQFAAGVMPFGNRAL